MDVYLDDVRLEIENPTLSVAIDHARRAALEHGRVIIEVKGDGAPVAADLLDNPDAAPTPFSELRLVSTPPGPMAREILLEARDTLDSARADQAHAAELIQSGSLAEALDPLQSALEAWSLVREVVDKIQALTGADPAAVSVRARGATTTGAECVAALTRTLADLRAALRASDWSALSDLLAYDLDEQADRWKAMLASMADAAESPPGSGSAAEPPASVE